VVPVELPGEYSTGEYFATKSYGCSGGTCPDIAPAVATVGTAHDTGFGTPNGGCIGYFTAVDNGSNYITVPNGSKEIDPNLLYGTETKVCFDYPNYVD
jgi:hypothetical protein